MKSCWRAFLISAGALFALIRVVPATAEQPDAGAIYKQKCSMCHGPDGKGYSALKTPDFTDPKWQESVKDKEIEETIKNGKKDTPMPAFGDKLKDEEVQALVTYVRSLNSKKK